MYHCNPQVSLEQQPKYPDLFRFTSIPLVFRSILIEYHRHRPYFSRGSASTTDKRSSCITDINRWAMWRARETYDINQSSNRYGATTITPGCTDYRAIIVVSVPLPGIMERPADRTRESSWELSITVRVTRSLCCLRVYVTTYVLVICRVYLSILNCYLEVSYVAVE